MSDPVTQIKERLDLGEVVGEYVALTRVGTHFRALCPFHQEKTPSFIVTPDKGIWHCFGCGEGGDVFSFVQRMEGLGFAETLRLLAERAGVSLPKTRAVSGAGEHQERQRLLEVLSLAARFYSELLVRHASGERVLSYLTARGVTGDTAEKFRLGWAGEQWDILQRFLEKRGYRREEMIATGLVGKSSRGTYYDRFRGRIIFPISDVQGRVVALAGRVTPWGEASNEGKYVNSPETSLYHKRRLVYNLHQAKQAIRQAGCAIVVEGYMDVILLTQAGVHNVVASSGTAFTPEQLTMIARFAHTLHFAFDADAAGWKAGVAATQTALSAGMRVALLTFPAGKDPADVALETPQELAHYLSHPQSLVRVALDHLRAAQGSDRETRLREVIPLVRTVTNPVQQGEMIQEIARDLHLAEERVAQLVMQQRAEGEGAVVTGAASFHRLRPEQELLGLLAASPEARRDFFSQLQLGFFIDDRSCELYKVLQGIASTHQHFFTMTADDLLRYVPEGQAAFASAVHSVSCARVEAKDRRDEAQRLLRWLLRRSLVQRRDHLQRQLEETTASDRGAVLREFQTVVEQLEGAVS